MTIRAVTRIVAVGGALAIMVLGCSRQPQATPTPARTSQPVATPAPDPKRCPVTTPNGKAPPGEQPSANHHGNGALWTGLPSGGVSRSGTLESDGSISQKFFWWTVGTTGELSIEGQRLDTAAAPLWSRINSGVPETAFRDVPGGRFWSSAIYFPTEGCWKVTGHVGTTSLTFVLFMANPS